MGTRHLISAVTGGQTKLAQYGQWDGYPSGQGVEILKFLRTLAAEPGLRNHFISRLEQCRFGTDAEIEAAYAPFSTGGYMNMEQADAFKKSEFAHLSRDTSADILTKIMESKAGLLLQDASEFVNDGMFCEWAYVIDFDANVLRVLNGADATFPLDKLPTDKAFCKKLSRD